MPTAMTFASLQTDLQNYLERGTVLDPIVFAQLPELINHAERRIARELKVMGFIVAATFNMQPGLAVYAKPDRWRELISLNVGMQSTSQIVYPVTQVFAGSGAVTYLGAFPATTLVGQFLTFAGFVNSSNNGTFQVLVSGATFATVASTTTFPETVPATATLVSSVLPYKRQQVFPRSYEYVRTYWPDDTQTNTTIYGSPGAPKFYAEYNYQNIIVAPTPDLAYPAELVYYEEPALLDATNGTNWTTAYAPNLLLYSSLLECAPFLKNDERIPTWQAMYDRTAAMINNESDDGILDRNPTRKKT